MEFGIFDFPKFSQGLLVKGGMGQRGLEWKPGDVAPSSPRSDWKSEASMRIGRFHLDSKSLATADVATNTVAFSDFYIYFASSFISAVGVKHAQVRN
jgi:hypothetical protein